MLARLSDAMTIVAGVSPVTGPGATAPRANKPEMLCVDDEPRVLEGLALVLRRHFKLQTAASGAEALALLDGPLRPAVIMSDMRMPGMNGAAFLAAARDKAPEAVRVLLTGQADLDSAISAVNDGGIFRFLTKPCSPPTLLKATLAAAEQHRLVTAEKELLEQTLVGSIKALTDILSISSPLLFGRATRVRKLMQELQLHLGQAPHWQLDAACMLSQIGSVALPPEVAGKLAGGRALNARESQMVDSARGLSVQLVANIPRLEGVIALLDGANVRWAQLTHALVDSDPARARSAQLLRAVTSYDALETAGKTPARAIEAMRAAVGDFDPVAVDALHALRVGTPIQPVRECRLVDLVAGMTLAQDVRLPNGTLLISRGHEVTTGLLARLENFDAVLSETRFRVYDQC